MKKTKWKCKVCFLSHTDIDRICIITVEGEISPPITPVCPFYTDKLDSSDFKEQND